MIKIISTLLLFFTLAFGDRDGGPYIGLGYGISSFNDNGAYEEQHDIKSQGITLYTGAYINKYLSVEFNYIDFNTKNDYIVQQNDELETISFTTYNVSTLAHYAFFNDILDFYAKFGVGKVNSRGVGDISGFTMLYGGGVGIRLSKIFGIRMAYEQYLIEHTMDSKRHDMKIDFFYSALEVQF